MTSSYWHIVTLAGGLLVAGLTPVYGQDRESEAGVAVYEPAAFREFLPRNALEIVNRLPGFGINGGDNVRGLSGAQGNVLINGRRPPRGSGSLSARIAAIRVEDLIRLELIEAGARDVDMQGYPLLLNIVTRQTAATRVDGRIEIEPREDGGEEQQGELTASLTGGRLELEARVDLYDETLTDYGEIRTSTADDPEARASVDEIDSYTRRDWQALATYHLDERNDFEVSLATERRDNSSRPTPDVVAGSGLIEAGRSASVERFGSARWRHDLTDAVQLIGLATRRQGERIASNSLLSGGSLSESASTRETSETAIRTDLRWRPRDTLTLETGLTWASNMLEGASSAYIDGVEQAVDGDDAQVEETRSAVLASATWIPTSRISATLGGRIEHFSLESSNQGGASLSLTDVAPRADLNWTLENDWTLRLSTEREVGQLNLDQFLASTDLDNALSTAGAATLEPPRDWVHEITLERRLGERDLLRLRAAARRSDNPVSSILDEDGNVRPANIGPERIERATAEFELDLSRYGMTGLSIEGYASRRWSGRLDPLQGFARNTSGHRDFDLSFGVRQEWAEGRYVISAEVKDRAPATHYGLTAIRKEANGVSLALDGELRHAADWRSGVDTRWEGDRKDTIYVFDGVRRPGEGPVLVNTQDRSEGVYVALWSEWEVREAAFFRISLRSGRERTGISRVDTPEGVFRDELSRQADNVPSLNLRLRFQR